MDKSLVCPYLVGLDHAELRFPLAMFQAALANKSETNRLVHTINKSLVGNALPQEQLNETFELWWPKLEEKLSMAPIPSELPEPQSEKEMLHELVTLIRYQVLERRPEDRISEFIALVKGLFQGLQGFGAPPLPPQLEDALRTSMVAAMKPGSELIEDLHNKTRDIRLKMLKH